MTETDYGQRKEKKGDSRSSVKKVEDVADYTLL